MFASSSTYVVVGAHLCNFLVPANNFYLKGEFKQMETAAHILWRTETLIAAVGLCIGSAQLVRSGYLFLTACGDTERLREAKDILWHSVIGSAILVGTLMAMGAIRFN